MWFVLWALLPLDLAAVDAAAGSGVHVEPVLDGRTVGARLSNAGKQPIDVLVGYTCGGPESFVAIVDGVERSFQTGTIVCSGNAMRIERLAAGGSTVVRTQTLVLDGAAHTLAVRYAPRTAVGGKLWHGAVTSARVAVPRAELALSLRATPGPTGGAVAVEITHLWQGATHLQFFARWLGACAGPADTLIVDDLARGFVENACDGPAAGAAEPLGPGESFVNRGVVHLPAGLHRVRARYRVTADDYRIVFGKKGNIGDWTGEVETPEVEVLVR
jgi:hypothetical protein